MPLYSVSRLFYEDVSGVVDLDNLKKLIIALDYLDL
jgi:hypothetical protein